MIKLPGSVLFICNMNSVRSAMAENMLKFLHKDKIFVDSAGVHPSVIDNFAVKVMSEINIDMSAHKPKSVNNLSQSSFDLVISLSPEAQHLAVEMTRTSACELIYWPTFDATSSQGSREQIILVYRQARDLIWNRIIQRFGDSDEV